MTSNTSRYYDARLQKVNDLWLAGKDRRALRFIRKSKWGRRKRYAIKAMNIGLPTSIIVMLAILVLK